jgi:hypothetical protein
LGAVGLDVETALRYCDALSRPTFVVSCHEGAFMEAITSASIGEGAHGAHPHEPGAKGIAIDRSNPYSPCDRYDDPHGESCWLFQGFVILRGVDFDAARALRICDTAPGGRAHRCYQSVGHQLAGLFQRSDGWIVEQCTKGDPRRAAGCGSGAALALASMDWSGERVNKYCMSVPTDWRDSCLTTAAEALALMSS